MQKWKLWVSRIKSRWETPVLSTQFYCKPKTKIKVLKKKSIITTPITSQSIPHVLRSSPTHCEVVLVIAYLIHLTAHPLYMVKNYFLCK
jgi:hypothetical protein